MQIISLQLLGREPHTPPALVFPERSLLESSEDVLSVLL
jgi:hypothetical protein